MLNIIDFTWHSSLFAADTCNATCLISPSIPHCHLSEEAPWNSGTNLPFLDIVYDRLLSPRIALLPVWCKFVLRRRQLFDRSHEYHSVISETERCLWTWWNLSNLVSCTIGSIAFQCTVFLVHMWYLCMKKGYVRRSDLNRRFLSSGTQKYLNNYI